MKDQNINEKNINGKIDHFYQKCQENNLSVTPQRLTIFNEICSSNNHPTADVVFKSVRKVLPNISFDTVNRTLITFAEIGFLDVVEGYGNPKRFDTDTHPHHHFWCVECNNIFDLPYDPKSFTIADGFVDKSFKVLRSKVVFEGLCNKCQYINN